MSAPWAARSRGSWSTLASGLDVQRRVVGALMLRELHTRYGRENIGYLWMLLEPGLLAVAVAAMHLGQKPHGSDLAPVGFALGAYCTFMIFRSIVGRSEAALEANQTLLFHRMVTILDFLLSRAILEALSTVATFILLITGACLLELATPPADLLVFGAGILLLTWFSFAVSMLVCAATYVSKAVAKFVHPAMYILMPISGAFYLLAWIPEPYRGWLSWSPLTQIFEMIHSGQFASVDSPYVDPVYIVGWCLALTLAGLFALRILRRNVHLS
jgi:capsular polysaccharide transport system permease protein